MAQTWNRFWIPLLVVKSLAVISVYVVMGYFLDTDNNEKIVSVFFVIVFTVLAFTNHPWVMKIWLLLLYLVPFVVYLLVRIIIWPFTLCCRCCRRKADDADSDAAESKSNRSEIVYEGGDEEDAKEGEDIHAMDSARDLEVKPKKKVKAKRTKAKSKPKEKAEKERNKIEEFTSNDIEKADPSQAEHLETNAAMSEPKKKVKKSKKKNQNKKDDKKDENDKAKDPNAKKKADRDTKNLDELNFFSRSWRCLKPRY